MYDDEDDDLPGEGHNSLAADERLMQYVTRYENLEEEKKGIMDDLKDVVSELRAVGYDPKIFRQIIKLRKMNPDDRREQEELLTTYMCALGMV